MAAFASISDLDTRLVRKALTGALFAAPYDSSVVLTTSNLFTAYAAGPPIQASGELVATLPAGYLDGGTTTDEGIRFTRNIDSDSLTGWQFLEPVREDRTSDAETLAVDFLETSRTTMELYLGADLSNKAYTNGAISIRKPALPTDRFWRLLALSVDVYNGKEFYIARHYPRCKVTGWSDQAFQKSGGLQWGMTFATYVDAAVGYSKDDMIGGPAFKDLDTLMGFAEAPA